MLHRVGLASSPDHRVPGSGWEVTEGRLPGGRRWAMSGPGGEVDGALVCLHGRGDDHRFTFDTIHLHDVVADEGLRLTVVSVDGGDDSYWHARQGGDDPEADVVEELVPLVRARSGTDALAVLGWSMGGYGALLLGERHPEVFPVVVAASPALFASYDDAPAGAFDSPDDFAEHDVVAGVDALDPARVRVDCGSHDPFAAASRGLVADLGEGVTSSFPSGWHDAPLWRSVAPAELRFIAAALS